MEKILRAITRIRKAYKAREENHVKSWHSRYTLSPAIILGGYKNMVWRLNHRPFLVQVAERSVNEKFKGFKRRNGDWKTELLACNKMQWRLFV
jgi:hypothetical protein